MKSQATYNQTVELLTAISRNSYKSGLKLHSGYVPYALRKLNTTKCYQRAVFMRALYAVVDGLNREHNRLYMAGIREWDAYKETFAKWERLVVHFPEMARLSDALARHRTPRVTKTQKRAADRRAYVNSVLYQETRKLTPTKA